MEKLYKIEMYLVDYNDENLNVQSELDNLYSGIFGHFGVKSKVIAIKEINYTDDIDINQSNCDIETYREYFNND